MLYNLHFSNSFGKYIQISLADLHITEVWTFGRGRRSPGALLVLPLIPIFSGKVFFYLEVTVTQALLQQMCS